MALQRDAVRRRNLSPENQAVIVGVGSVIAVLLAVTAGLTWIDLNILVGLITVLAILVVSIPALRWVARKDGHPEFARVMILGLFAKLIFTVIRFYFITVVYQDQGDAGIYSLGGSVFMEQFRRGNFGLTIPELETRGSEVMRIAAVVGMIYVVTGISRYAASFVFAWLCFVGQILMCRAFRRGVPEGDYRRYSMLVLFLPSMLFWPSSIGKEALMVFCIGVASYGAALLLGGRVNLAGIPVFLLGAGGLFYIRPHMALISVVSLGFASVVTNTAGFAAEPDKRSAARSFAIRMAMLVILLGAASLATTQLSAQLGGGVDGAAGLQGALDRTKSQTALGGSEYASVAVSSPVDLPAAMVTVLFRPFPWEARSLNGIISASEGMLLFGLLVASRRRLVTWAKMVSKRPYLVFAATFAMVFIIAFSYIGNFGILARQRTQMMPLVLTLVGMYPASRRAGAWFGARGERSDTARADEMSNSVAGAGVGVRSIDSAHPLS